MKKISVLFLSLFFVAGCANQSFTVNGSGSSPTQAKAQHFFVNGIGQYRNVDAADVCGGIEKVQKVEVQQTFVNGLFSVLTFGIYTPRTARVYCS